MVPKQEIISRDESDVVVERPLFGSQLVDENSPTPYSDATQVRVSKSCIFFYFIFFRDLRCEKKKNIYKKNNINWTPSRGRVIIFVLIIFTDAWSEKKKPKFI